MRFRLWLWLLPLLACGCPAAPVLPLVPPVPTEEQRAWQDLELTLFVHFGINTFTDREWGLGNEDPALFNPTKLDARQWAQAAKAGGFKLMILTAKHHDGFCLWPSKFTTHSVARSPWKDGKGDVVREFVEACRAENLKVGLYLSPWDRHEPTYGTDAYNTYFTNQLAELLTRYGPIDEVWFDGACGEGPNGKKQVYDWPSYYATIRALAPKAVIAISGPDIRWVGNESGVARVGESSVQPASAVMHGRSEGKVWWPAECDVSIRPGWFYHATEDSKVKSLRQLLDIYFKSVGRNSVMLLNVPPNKEGLFAAPDVRRLHEFGEAIRRLFASDLARNQPIEASSRRAGPERDFAPANAVDGDPTTFWAGEDGITGAELLLRLPKGVKFNLVSVREPYWFGERARAWRLEAQDASGIWKVLARGTVIGSRNLLSLPETTASQVRLVIESALGCPAISELALYHSDPAPARAAELKDYPLRPVSWTAVRVTDGFWTPRLETNRLRTVWYDFEKCEETGRIDNFAKAGKLMEGPFKGTPFDDSDVFKVIEGAACTLATHPDPKLDRYLDDLIAKIAAAQEPDGYLYTARTIDPRCRLDFFGPTRWSNLRVSHELYNAGHLYEAAVAHFEATGKRTLLEVALRNAELVCRTFGPGPDQLKEPPGHQEIEIGLVRLYRATGERKYLDQAQFFCDLRGRAETHPLRGPYQQDHLPIVEQREAVGHAVRAGYFYCGVADVAALTGRKDWTRAVDGLWKNTVERKMHLTGGIGARAEGEAFGADYELPNASAYLETCAAIAHALWNHRMFLMHGDGCYFDVLERVIYNGFLAGVSLGGDRFFYPNPLENAGNYQRSPWFGCSCCPVNVVRFLPQVPGFAYATRGRQVFVNLFLGGTAKFEVAGTPLEIQQETRYPWDGKVLLRITPQQPAEFRLSVRIPGWARNQPVPGDLYRYDDHLQPKVKLAVNGNPVRLDLEQGYAPINRTWQRGDTVTLDLDLPVRRVAAHPEVKADRNRFAIERGPLVYCAEGADNGGKVLDTFLPGNITFAVAERPDLLGGILTIKARSEQNGAELTSIPYYAWCHRGANEMRVWHPVAPQTLPASHCWERDTVEACFDGRLPKASNDHSIPRFTWWDHRGTLEWVRRDFQSPQTVSAVEVFWFDDTGAGSCRAPKSWQLLYKDGDQWRPVKNRGDYGVRLDQFNVVEFDPVNTASLRIEAQLQPDFSAGILEWRAR